MAEQRSPNEYFRTVSLGNRKSCPTCKEKLGPMESIWSWGEYQYGKWRTVDHFCKKCFASSVHDRLAGHIDSCGCEVNLVGKSGTKLPDWLAINESGGCKPRGDLVADLIRAGLDSMKELRSRISNVCYAELSDGMIMAEVIEFELDGVTYTGELLGRNEHGILSEDAERDASLAVCVLLDGDASVKESK